MAADCKYDIRGFSADLGLPLPDIANLYSELVQEIAANVAVLQDLLPAKDWEAIRATIHNIKGISVNYRVMDLYEEAVKIHNAVKAGAYDQVAPEVKMLVQISRAAIREIKQYFAAAGIPIG